MFHVRDNFPARFCRDARRLYPFVMAGRALSAHFMK